MEKIPLSNYNLPAGQPLGETLGYTPPRNVRAARLLGQWAHDAAPPIIVAKEKKSEEEADQSEFTKKHVPSVQKEKQLKDQGVGGKVPNGDDKK